MDFELSEEQRAFAQTARDFALSEFAPHAARWDAEAIFPKEAIGKAGGLGFCGLYAPESIDGLALPRLDATLVFEEMAAVDPSTTAFITIHNMATWMLGTWGTEAVRARWGADLTSGRKLASYCLTEPGAGSDAGSLKTRAELQGGEYVINGGKAFISGAGATDVLVLMPGASTSRPAR
ncbi:MAG: acyl-CoA dehydrogenase, partial [Comamonadaceae bacterium]